MNLFICIAGGTRFELKLYADGKGSEARFSTLFISFHIHLFHIYLIYFFLSQNCNFEFIYLFIFIAGGTRFESKLYADGKGSEARFSTPTNIVIDNHGNIIVADWKNSVLRMIKF